MQCVDRGSIESCTFQFLQHQAPPPSQSISLNSAAKTLSAAHNRWFAMKRRRRGGSRSLSGRNLTMMIPGLSSGGTNFHLHSALHCTYKLVSIMLPSWEEWVITRCRKLIAAVRNKN